MTTPDTTPFPIVQTKLNHPLIPADLVSRPRLTEWLKSRRQRPLTLVSAPAGYGKSTLVSSWLENCECPGAWLSLDEYDNDLVVFLSHFLAGIQTIFPKALNDTQAQLTAPNLPPMRVLASSLSNEMNQIDRSYIMVLDDYQFIGESTIHDLVNELVLHPPQGLHLVICTRIDPPISLASLRAKSQVTEIRGQDLCFTEEEAHTLLQKILETGVERSAANSLVEQSEGWVTGIRLAALALRHRIGKESVQLLEGELTANNRYVSDYLMSEILENQVAVFSDWLLKTSILEKLNAELCESVCVPEDDPGESEINGKVFLKWLKTSNLFVTHLDDQGQWVRYHHLFQDFLQNELARRYSADEISVLHRRASAWYAGRGLIEKALHHALSAGDIGAATELVVENRHEALNQEHWGRLQRWLNLLPAKATAKSADLLLVQAWVLNSKFRFEDVFAILEQVQALVDQEHTVLTVGERSILEGEMAALRCIPYYWVGQGQLSLDYARLAVEVTPVEHRWVRGIGQTYYAGAYQLVGQLDRAYEEIHEILADSNEHTGTYVHRAYITKCAIELLAGNLSGAEGAALQLLDLSQPRRLYDTMGWALYVRGMASYQRNKLAQASQSFLELIEMRYQTNAGAAAQGFYGMALTHQAMGKSGEAQRIIQDALAWATETGNAGMLIETDALASRLALMQGQRSDTHKWAGLIGENPPLLLLLHIPHLTLANILAVEGTSAANAQANDLLARLRQFAVSTHSTWRLMEITAMQALLKDTDGDHKGALTLLEPVIEWSEPRGYIRLFADMGPNMAELLDRLRQQAGIQGSSASEFITKILAAFETEGDTQEGLSPPPSLQVVDPLTNRESEILELLGKRLTNKEIAAQLVIAPGTVEQHLVRIYAKLDVRGRRQAVAKAKELGLLSA